ncbi:hypothetical protein VNO77_37472 [Canavalia gladiata]|uniref:Uncharacterized protein n=1 Tax=Canavalia gladiata TaxID=3824 RepID=A0AAN9PX54_CANGL
MSFMFRSESCRGIDDDNNWSVAIEEGNIERLYKLIKDDPNVLEDFDAIPFVQTPLDSQPKRTYYNSAMFQIPPITYK